MALWEQLERARLVDLSQPFRPGMPVSPNHPPFQLYPIRRHGDVVRNDGGSATSELILTGGHVGTHIDALGHVSQDGRLHGGEQVSEVGTHLGLASHGAEELPLLIGRGICLDVAAALHRPRLAPAYEISVDDLEAAASYRGVIIQPGDAVLIRTGWSQLWNDPPAFIGHETGVPGIGPEAASWLVDQGVKCVGGETLAVEVIPPGAGHALLPVHRILIVEAGVPMIECLNLQPLHEGGIGSFTLVALPLRLEGASGSPVRPVAIIDD